MVGRSWKRSGVFTPTSRPSEEVSEGALPGEGCAKEKHNTPLNIALDVLPKQTLRYGIIQLNRILPERTVPGAWPWKAAP